MRPFRRQCLVCAASATLANSAVFQPVCRCNASGDCRTDILRSELPVFRGWLVSSAWTSPMTLRTFRQRCNHRPYTRCTDHWTSGLPHVPTQLNSGRNGTTFDARDAGFAAAMMGLFFVVAAPSLGLAVDGSNRKDSLLALAFVGAAVSWAAATFASTLAAYAIAASSVGLCSAALPSALNGISLGLVRHKVGRYTKKREIAHSHLPLAFPVHTGGPGAHAPPFLLVHISSVSPRVPRATSFGTK